MERNFPSPIVNENDLKFYDEYIKRCDNSVQEGNTAGTELDVWIENRPAPRQTRGTNENSNSEYLNLYLNGLIGKLIRVESLIGGCLERRIGTLMKVGADFLVIKLYQSCSTMIIEANTVKYITVIHDNDLNKAGLF